MVLLIVAAFNLVCMLSMYSKKMKKDKEARRILDIAFILFNVVIFLKALSDLSRGHF